MDKGLRISRVGGFRIWRRKLIKLGKKIAGRQRFAG
jgi:hypothetical protein